jgi:hypothetical protein
MVFVTDGDNSDKYIEELITEHNTIHYKLKIDRTLKPPEYELFREWVEDKRRLHALLFSSSKIEKVIRYVNENL